MKKALKIIGIILGVLIVLLVVSPFIFKGNLEKMLKRTINKNLNATVAWENLDLSLISSFPDATLQLNNFSITNKAPFEGDTLVSGKKLNLEMGFMQLFKSKDLQIDAITLDQAFINIKIDSLGNTNYDIALKDDAPIINDKPSTDDSFTFQLKNYEIKDSRITYLDEEGKILLTLTEVQHKGSGDLSEEVSNLDTQTSAFASFKMDDTEYLTNNRIALNAIFNIDFKSMKISFLKNEGKINDLPLTFEGYTQINETNNEVDLTFKTPSSDFKNFLAVIPKAYVKQISDVKTTGNFTVNGVIKGIVDSVHIPTMDIRVASDNASFKYPDLPKTVDNISIDIQLINESGLLLDTYLNIPKLTFRIDGEPFRMNGSVKNMMDNPFVNMEMQGTLNLANLKQVLPLDMEQNLTGIFNADVAAKFDMESVEKEQYHKIDARGNASLTNFNYDAGFKNDLKISKASLSLQAGNITLKELNANTGQTDINASGSIQNLIPFLMSKQELKGRFDVKSNVFNVNDFMVAEESPSLKETSKKEKSPESKTEETIMIPSFLDASLSFNANTVIYDNLELKNAKGNAVIKNETISLSNFTSDIFGGNIAFSGNVSTKEEVPTFGMKLDLSKIDIDQSFEGLEMFQFLVPIAKALHGSLNTKFELNGQLTNELSPVLSTLGGSALAEIITAEVDPDQAPILAAIGSKVSFLNLDKLSLRDVTTNLTFNNGKIEVQPFHFDIKGVDVAVSGTHGLDKAIDYNLKMDIPAKYLGSDVTKLLQNLSEKEANEMSISLPVGLKGSFSNPQVSLNTETAINQLTQRLMDKQKDKLIDKGSDFLSGLIDGATKKDTTETKTPEVDSTKTESSDNTKDNTKDETKDRIKGALEGIFKKAGRGGKE